jgi:hypothetical protein
LLIVDRGIAKSHHQGVGWDPRETLIKAIPGLNQLALPEARLVERSIFNGLAP